MRKYFFLLFLLAGSSLVLAQKKIHSGKLEFEAHRKADLIAFDSIVKLYGTQDEMAKFADEVCADYKGDVDFEIYIATAFGYKGSNMKVAEQRLDRIIKRYPRYMPTYIEYSRLLSQHSLRLVHDDSLNYVRKARHLIDTCKQVLPDSLEPYRAWARWFVRRDTLETDAQFEAMHARFPQSQAYLEAARLYRFTYKPENGQKDYPLLNKALSYYNKADHSKMPENDLFACSELYYLVNLFDKSLAISLEGHTKYPENPEFMRYILWNNYELARASAKAKDSVMVRIYYTDALQMADKFLNHTDTLKREMRDYLYVAETYRAMAQYDRAVPMFRQALDIASQESDSLMRYRYQSEAMESMSRCFLEQRDYGSAIEAFKDKLDLKHQHGKVLDAYDYDFMATLYYNYALTDTVCNEEVRRQAYRVADSLYARVIDIAPEYTVPMNQKRLQIAQILYDNPDAGNGHDTWAPEIRDAALLLVSSIEQYNAEHPDSPAGKTYGRYLANGYFALALHHFFNDENKMAFKYAEIVMQLPGATSFQIDNAKLILSSRRR